MASVGAIWGPATLRLLRIAVTKTSKAIRTKLVEATRPVQGQAQHIPIRNGYTGRQPIHPAALLKQQKRGPRWFSTATTTNINNVLRRFISSERGASPRLDRSRLPSSNTSRRVAQFSGRAPFASALRPNLTGGAMPRTAGGYSLGGGARYFSHSPAAPAQVVQNVSQAMRAFFLSGQKLRYDGVGAQGERKYRVVSNLEDEAMRKLADIPRSAPGSFIDFQVSPTITALSPLAAALACASQTSGFRAEAAALPATLNTDGFLDVLSADFGRALKDLTTIYADLRRLSVLGDLPIVLEQNNTLRVRFPGVDASTVERLCDDIGIQRGVVSQDPGFDFAVGAPVALRFPFAPDVEKTVTSPGGSVRSLEGHELDDMSSLEDNSFVREAFAEEMSENPWLSEPEGYESISPPISSGEHCSDEFEGFEGIYRFLEECDRGQGRFG
ncbi:Uncharacterized protein TPAR_07815 [Tolypocladium paradoxum]|uniref:Casein kinase II beta 2 subunit n=1 Tax=Tolypocladium paradoxum TaxID=94208 RepID=A0A2S4KP95_9HYPO|nr:Uncharacterized protein TPAR_07815 [Tolypocladium paradoxum]